MVFLCRYGVNLIKGTSFGHCQKPYFHRHGLKYYSQQANERTLNSKFIPMMKMICDRRTQAMKSILVQVQSAQSYKELYSYCNSIGTVNEMFHYSEESDQMHYIVVEFATQSDVKDVLAASTHLMENQMVPTNSHFLWFRASNRKLGKLKQNKAAKLSMENGTTIIKEDDLKTLLRHCTTISDQIEELHNLTMLNDVGSRLRFLTARQVESTVSGLFPNVCAFPFGSSVNGFGKMGCDLDLVLRLADQKENNESRLIYHCKAGFGSERSTNQRNMEAIGDLINLFLPGCAQVRRILQAKVPIIKYHQQLTNIECDLSMTNMSGVYMSDFLYIMGELDKRVRPLIFTIRKWAKEVGLTNQSPGRWITNFSLTLLALAFLQKPLYSPPVLPTLNTLVKLAGPSDKYITEDNINCTFLRDMTKLNFKRENDKSLEELLLEFFEFYSQFDFHSKAICLNEAVSITKPEYSAMYIVNPLERGLNVSKNVSLEEVEKFKIEVRNAAWLLESKENKLENMGIFSIFDNRNREKFSKLNFAFSSKQNRLMEISTLFDENNEKNEAAKNIIYKNKEVEKEVEMIRKEAQEKIKSLDLGRTRQKSER